MELPDITKVTLDEINELQIISRNTFYDTFFSYNTAKNMKDYLDEAFSIEKLTTELSDENIEYYFAKIGNRIIGYLKINFAQSQTELQVGNAAEIERIYVIKEFHGKNVGQLLYEKACDRAREEKAAYIWLGVWENNPRAINFYKKNGFTEFDQHIFKLGAEEQTDIMLKMEL